MKCSLGISNFLEEISSLSHSVVFLCFFALTTEEGFLISSCYSLELCIQMIVSFLFSAKWLSGEALQIAVNRKETKGKGEKERYTHLNAQCKEQQGEIRKPSSVISAKKQRKTIE